MGLLRWDGKGWSLDHPSGSAHDEPVTLQQAPQVLLDLQSHLWLCATTAGRGRLWLWLERSAQPEHWWDLRRAVYSRARLGGDHVDAKAPAPLPGRES